MNEMPKFGSELAWLIGLFVAAGCVVYVGVKVVGWIIEHVKIVM
jgi:hypothetical protein